MEDRLAGNSRIGSWRGASASTLAADFALCCSRRALGTRRGPAHRLGRRLLLTDKLTGGEMATSSRFGPIAEVGICATTRLPLSNSDRPPLPDIEFIRRIGRLAGRYPGSRRRSRSRRAQSLDPSAPDHLDCKDRVAAAPISAILETRPKNS